MPKHNGSYISEKQRQDMRERKRGDSLAESHKTNKQRNLPQHLILLQTLQSYLVTCINRACSSSRSPEATELLSTTVYPAGRSWAHNEEQKLRAKTPQNL